MKKLDLYIVRKFLGTFFFAILLIISIAVVFVLVEKIDDFAEKGAPLKAIIFEYYLNFIPYFANLFTPLFVFIAVIFFTSKMASHTEITAMHASGISFNRFLRPYMLASTVIALLSWVLIIFTKSFSIYIFKSSGRREIFLTPNLFSWWQEIQYLLYNSFPISFLGNASIICPAAPSIAA